MARMKILSPSAQSAFDTPPLLDHRERQMAFEFSAGLLEIAQTLRQPSYQVLFLVSCGYFKISKRFFSPADFHQRDLEYVARKLSVKGISNWNYPNRARQRHQTIILEFYGFRSFDDEASKRLEIEIKAMARQHLKPRLIFERCTDFLVQQKYQLPKAGTLIELIRNGLRTRKEELVMVMESQLTDSVRMRLDALFAPAEQSSRYRLTLLKRISQSNKPTQIKETVADFQTIAELFEELKSAASALALGTAGIHYYAVSVMRSRIFQMQQRSEPDRYIHAIAFITHQLYRLGDALVDQLLSAMASFQATVIRRHKERLFEQRKEQTAQLRLVMNGLDQSVFAFRHSVEALADDRNLSDAQKVRHIKELLETTEPPDIQQLQIQLADGGEESYYYELLERQSLRLQNRISLSLSLSDRHQLTLIDCDVGDSLIIAEALTLCMFS